MCFLKEEKGEDTVFQDSSCQSVFSDQYVFFLVAYPQLLWTHREISIQVIDSVLFIPVLPGKSAYFDFNLFSIFFNYKVSLDSDHLGLSIPPCVSGALNLLQTYGSDCCLPLLPLMTVLVGSKFSTGGGQNGQHRVLSPVICLDS